MDRGTRAVAQQGGGMRPAPARLHRVLTSRKKTREGRKLHLETR